MINDTNFENEVIELCNILKNIGCDNIVIELNTKIRLSDNEPSYERISELPRPKGRSF